MMICYLDKKAAIFTWNSKKDTTLYIVAEKSN